MGLIKTDPTLACGLLFVAGVSKISPLLVECGVGARHGHVWVFFFSAVFSTSCHRCVDVLSLNLGRYLCHREAADTPDPSLSSCFNTVESVVYLTSARVFIY